MTNFRTAVVCHLSCNSVLLHPRDKSDHHNSVTDLSFPLSGVPVISFSDWEKIDQYEIAEGQKKGKAREKIVEHSKFLDVALHG